MLSEFYCFNVFVEYNVALGTMCCYIFYLLVRLLQMIKARNALLEQVVMSMLVEIGRQNREYSTFIFTIRSVMIILLFSVTPNRNLKP